MRAKTRTPVRVGLSDGLGRTSLSEIDLHCKERTSQLRRFINSSPQFFQLDELPSICWVVWRQVEDALDVL